MVRPRLALCLLVLLLLAPASLARASAYSKVLRVYQQSGSVPACAFSTGQLTSALKGVDLYGAQYFADFTNAIQNALTARAAGACTSVSSRPVSTGAGSGSAGAPGSATHLTLPPGQVTAPTQADFPAPLLLLVAFAALAMLIAGTVSIFWLRGREPAVMPWWRHLWQETGFRAGGVWAEFLDWLRSA